MPTLVDVRTESGYAHGLTFIHEFRDFGDVVEVAAHHGCHILGWMVGLEIGRLICHPRIACGVTLVEGVGGEFFPVAPYLLKHCRVVTVFLSTLDKLGFHGIYDSLFLLTHSLAQGVALTASEICQLARQKHHLLLIYGDSVGVLQIFLHAGYVILYLLATVLARNKRGDIIHRTWTIKGVHGDDVLEYCRLEFAKVFLHTRRFKLEGADGASLGI